MTQDDARRIKEAAIVMLHAIEPDLGDNAFSAALRYLPVHSDQEERISLHTAHELLEGTHAWIDADNEQGPMEPIAGITIGGRGDAAMHLELGDDGGVRFIRLSRVLDGGDRSDSEVWIDLDRVHELVRALQTFQAQANSST
jgi:hypothetical protein